MKRIDRIFGALSDSNNNCNENNGDKYNSTISPGMTGACNELHGDKFYNSSTDRIDNSVVDLACNENHGLNFHIRKCFASADKGFTLKAASDLACNEINSHSDKTITAQMETELPCYGILRPDNDNTLIDSPLAPLYSPLTPLLARKEDYDGRTANSSPLRPLSPDTLKLFQTFGALDDDDDFDKGCKEIVDMDTHSKDIKNYQLSKCDSQTFRETRETPSDFSIDTDSDFVPDTDEDSDSRSSSTRPRHTIDVQALVHQNENTTNTGLNHNLTGINSQRKVTHDTENEIVLSEDRNNERSVTVIDRQILTDTVVSDSDNDIETLNDNQPENATNVTITSEDLNNVMSVRSINRQILTDSEMSKSDNDIETLSSDSQLKNATESVASPGRPKRGRKRKYQEHTLAQAKKRKYENLPYHSKKRHVVPKVFRDYACTCTKVCNKQIPEELRQKEFEKYVTLGSYEAQLLYILSCVTETPKTRAYVVLKGNKSGKKRPRSFTRKYTIGDIEVCREMFINTFQITPKKVDVALKKVRMGNTVKDLRGQSRGGWNKTNEQDLDFIRNVIDSIPKYKSHYRREQNNGAEYVKPGTTLRIIYDLYLEKLKEAFGENKKPVAFTTVKRIFFASFNLRFKGLKKDTCSRCDTLHNKINNIVITAATTTTQQHELKVQQDKLKEEKEKHLKRAEDLRNRMNEDLKKAKSDNSFECLTFDLEKTLPLPRIPTSIVFYKRQLWLYNCGIHVGSTDCGHCYTWVEGEAGRGAQEVGSCLINFIKNKLDPKVEHLSLWSDCCGGQNRNIKIVLMLKVILNSHPTLKTITLNYLESGHTFLPNDTDFSKIETQLKYHERIYTADEYIRIMKYCKKKNPLQVYKMKKEEFLSSKNIEKKIVNRKTFVNKNKTNWLLTKEILLKKENKDAVFMKMNLEDQFQELNIEKKVKGRSVQITEDDFCMLWPNGKEIPQAKLDDLKSMFDLIPKDCLPFYYTLRGNPFLEDDIDGYGGERDFIPEDEEIDLNINNIET